jgi:hypothetical protein
MASTEEHEHLQNENAPAIVAFAMAAGKSTCASLVKGYDNAAKSAGGMTSLNLDANMVSLM